VLLAVGRAPLTADIGLAAAGVRLDARGFVMVDAYERTSVPSILALGDATDSGWELTPVAIAAGWAPAERLFSSYATRVSSLTAFPIHTIIIHASRGLQSLLCVPTDQSAELYMFHSR
jgi:pyruvate/2-oxoglutarate dehydrogenase complex dihydrolipoamide dehydrogenase (E3) component